MLKDMTTALRANMSTDEAEDLEATLAEHVDADALGRLLRVKLIEHFTAEELGALADFYGSEVGRSALAKHAAFTSEVLPLLQREATRALKQAHEDR